MLFVEFNLNVQQTFHCEFVCIGMYINTYKKRKKKKVLGMGRGKEKKRGGGGGEGGGVNGHTGIVLGLGFA